MSKATLHRLAVGRKPWSAVVRTESGCAGEGQPDQAVRAHRLVDVDHRRQALAVGADA